MPWTGLAFLLETTMSNMLNATRFSLGFYAGIVLLLFNAIVVLAVLLAETTKLYARRTSMRQGMAAADAHLAGPGRQALRATDSEK
jgi:hypothetical protein